MRLRVIATALVALSLLAGSAFAGTGIGIYSAQDASSCNISIPAFVATPIYVILLGSGPAVADNATGAEYKIDNMPGVFGGTYFANLTNAPNSNLNIGNAFDGVGHNVAFPVAQTGLGDGTADNNLLLATYSILLFNPIPATTLLVTGRTPPNNALFPCPLWTDAGFGLHCVPGGELHVNGTGDCTVAVEEQTWSGVRNLYR